MVHDVEVGVGEGPNANVYGLEDAGECKPSLR